MAYNIGMSTIVDSRQLVVDRIRDLAPQLRALGITRVALFGSFVNNRQHAASDVDLLVEFAPARKTFNNFSDACDLLEGVLGRRVELVTVDSLSPFIGPKILREAIDVFVSA